MPIGAVITIELLFDTSLANHQAGDIRQSCPKLPWTIFGLLLKHHHQVPITRHQMDIQIAPQER